MRHFPSYSERESDLLCRLYPWIVMCQAWLGPKADGFGLAYLDFGLNVVEARPEAGGKPKPGPGFGSSAKSSFVNRLTER